MPVPVRQAPSGTWLVDEVAVQSPGVMGVEYCPIPGLRQPLNTSRSWAAVTSEASSAGPRCTASSSATQEVRPDSSAATMEYGPAGHELVRLALPTYVDVAEQPLVAGRGIRTEPGAPSSFPTCPAACGLCATSTPPTTSDLRAHLLIPAGDGEQHALARWFAGQFAEDPRAVADAVSFGRMPVEFF